MPVSQTYKDELEIVQECYGIVDADVPVIESIHQRVLEAVSKPEALKMDEWHTCSTTHCRAGWVTQLAGHKGYALETTVGTDTAALLIYLKSDPTLTIEHSKSWGSSNLDDWWYQDEESALKHIREMAEKEIEGKG